jgi:putative membrane protein
MTMMMYGWDGWGWGGWVVMTVVMVLFWALVITAVVLAVRYLAGSPTAASRRRGAGPPRGEDLLADRFARGEIDDEEYRRRLTLLRDRG